VVLETLSPVRVLGVRVAGAAHVGPAVPPPGAGRAQEIREEDCMKLFVTKNCPKCEMLKLWMDRNRASLRPEIEVVDIGTADGLAQAAYLGIVTMTAPVLVIDEPQVFTAVEEIQARMV
jgi:glutaredoxin